MQDAQHHLLASSSLKRIIEALRSVPDGLAVTQSQYLLAGHEFLEEEDVAQSVLNGGHDLDQYLRVDYLALEIEGETIFMLQIENVSSDELFHANLVRSPHLRHHELVYPGQPSELETHSAVEVRVAAHDLAEVLFIDAYEAHGGFAIEAECLHVLTDALHLFLSLG